MKRSGGPKPGVSENVSVPFVFDFFFFKRGMRMGCLFRGSRGGGDRRRGTCRVHFLPTEEIKNKINRVFLFDDIFLLVFLFSSIFSPFF